MLSLHKKRRTIISTFVAVAVLLPAVGFVASKIVTSDNTFAANYPIPEGYTSIVDPNFYNCVADTFVTYYIQPAEEIPETGLTDDQLARIEQLTCNGSGKPVEALITDATGLDKMSSLWYLDLGNNQLASIDISNNPGMWYLDLNNNQLTSIDLSGSTTLDQAYLYSNQLTSIDVSHNTKLTRLDIFDNQLTFVDVSSNAAKLQTLKADNVYLYTGITPTKSGNDYIYDLSGLKYIKDGSHGPDSNVDFTIENTSNYSYDEDNMILTISNLTGAGGYVSISGSIESYSYKFKLPVILNFDTNGGSGSFEIMNCYVESGASNCTITLPTTTPTRDDYTFLGWAESSTATAADYAVGAQVTLSGSKTLYAVWETMKTAVTLDFNLNGGEGTMNSVSCNIDVEHSTCAANIPNTNPNRIGYNFLGWADSATATSVIYQPGGSIALSADKTVYAVWEIIQTSVTLGFNLNGGTGTVSSVSCNVNVENPTCTVNIPNTNPNRTGYNFLGWANSSTATTADYAVGAQVTLSSNKTLYAVWEIIETTVTLDFNLNGGEGTVSSVSCNVNVENPTCTVNIPNTNPDRTGYNFLGWANSSTATTADYAVGAQVTLSSNKTLYAVWELKSVTHTLSYNANGGSGGPSSQNCTAYGVETTCSITISSSKPIRSGYNFLGWAESSTATAVDYAAGVQVTLSGNKTLYAVWEIIQTSVTLGFNLNGGTGTVSSVSCNVNVENPTCTVNIPNTNPNRTGYNFLGWANSSTATTADYAVGAQVTLSSNKTLYAVWEIIETTVTLDFNLNGGEGTVSSVSCNVNVENPTCVANIPNAMPNKTDYGFVGWADSASATTASYRAGDDITLDANKTLYAIWAPIYTLSYDSNGGSEAPEAISCHANNTTSGCIIIISSTELTKEGYKFLGWADEEEATEAAYEGGDEITISEDKTIYAVWEEVSDEEEPEVPGDDSEEEEDDELPVPNTGANMMGEGGAVLMFTLAPTIITASYLAIRYNKKVHFKND